MNLTGISSAKLERFYAAVVGRRVSFPLTRATLQGEGLDALQPALEALNAAGRDGALAAIQAVLAERGGRPAPAELVWTGPEARSSSARDTAVVLRDLFRRAERTVLLAGFAFDHAADVLKPLHEALGRGVACRLFADAQVAHEFLRLHWPFGPPFPELYAFTPEQGVFASLHAKCVVVDERWVFVTSANFTDRGQSRNVEVGVLLDDARLAGVLEAQFVGGAWFSRCRE